MLVSAQEFAALRSDPLMGTTLAGRYHIIGRVGTGGMGTVYRAEQVGLARNVALKVLKAEASYDRETVARFQREAKAMSMLLHTNTVRVFDFGEDPSGHLYLAMELLEGELLTARSDREATLDPKDAIFIVQQILRSLSEAHVKGLIHRDLKPDNIYLARIEGHAESVVKVLDFGIAKVFRDDGKPIDQLETQAGTVFGTPRYMSPEQAQGKQLDPRSDLYSVGVLLYQLLVGHPPFIDDDAVVVMAKHIRDLPEAPRKAAPERPIPTSLERVVMRSLEKDPTSRHASADEMDQALTACLADVEKERLLGSEGRRSSDMVLVGGRELPRRALAIGAGVVCLALLVGGVAVATSGPGGEPGPSMTTTPLVAVRTLPTTVGQAPPPTPIVSTPTPARTVRVSSEPSGAEIWQAGAQIGTTPHTFVVDATTPASPLELRLDGHDSADLDLLVAGPEATVTLPPQRRSPARGRPRSHDRDRDPPAITSAPPVAPPPPTTTATTGYERFD
jgi:eukaryotic-like serine/threonine-protein kinase